MLYCELKTHKHHKQIIVEQLVQALCFVCIFLSSLPPASHLRDGWTGFRLQRLYFVWVCRELQSFYWFSELLCALHHKVRTKYNML